MMDKKTRTEPRFQIVVTPIRPALAGGQVPGNFYACFQGDKRMGSFGSSVAEAIGYLVITTALKGPFVVEQVNPEPYMP